MQGGFGLKVNPVLGVKFYLAKILACRCGVMRGGMGLKVDPVLVVKFYLAKILACSGKNGILFPALRGRGKVLGVLPKIASYASVLQQFKNFAKLADIKGKPKDYGLQSFRHGAVTHAVNNGCDKHTVLKQMRVVSLKTVATYATLSRKRLGKANKCLFKKLKK